ncbi:MAG: DUF5615 family PIN-like protein [bacterium]
MKIVIDMSLSPDWVSVLEGHGWETLHWSTIGDPRAEDSLIMDWARTNGYIVFTHDLDFGTLLALSGAFGPSVIQVRTQDVMPHHLETILTPILRQYESLLETGALVTVDEHKSRVRVLPI